MAGANTLVVVVGDARVAVFEAFSGLCLVRNRRGELSDPVVEVASAVRGQAFDVAVGVVREAMRHGRGSALIVKLVVDERLPDAAVAVHVGVVRLKLSVRDGHTH